MKITAIFIISLFIIQIIFALEINGDVKNWQKEDFIGSDIIGDKNGAVGDISSVFSRIENDKLFLRITFDDMSNRKSNKIIKDNFSNEELFIKIVLTKKSNQQILLNQKISLDSKRQNTVLYNSLRTSDYNLFEISFPWKFPQNIDDISYKIEIIKNDKIIDEFQQNEKNQDGGGNCAFIHHGNQGLTYTEVFYGQYPDESSGFDEILEVHQATNIPGNFHMSGTLMPAAEWHNPEFNDWLSSGVYSGWASMMTSALGQHMMPFVNDDMNNWSVQIESDMVRHFYNYNPKVAWIPERVWLSPGNYPESSVIDWIGDNWTQHGVEAVVLDDWPHLSGQNNKKIHWMNNGSGINLRVIPIDNDFVGKMHYDASGAKNHIWNIGQYGISVYGTDWEVAAEMNEHHDTSRLDNYQDVLWWCYNNYPAVNVWKLDSALSNPDFNGTGVDINNGTYGLLGGENGYGGSNNSWYNNWAGTPSHSDFHNPTWNYGYIWSDAYNNLMTAPNNNLAQLGWYTLMINLHETGWHEGGSVAGWEHRYSSHMKNANVYAEAARWANGDYAETTAAYLSDIDHDGGEELIMYNDKIYAVFEGIGGKVNWMFYKNGYGEAYSVISSDVAYWSETDGDFNEGAGNHFAALSDVNPDQQSSIYQISIEQGTGNSVQATLSQWGVKKTIRLETGTDYLDVIYDFFGSTGYIKSGLTPDLLDLIWSGKSNLQRLYGNYGSYVGWRNSSSGASVALVLGSAGGNHNGEFEGTLVKGDEIYGSGIFSLRLFAGYTSPPYVTGVDELNTLASETVDLFGPQVEEAFIGGSNTLQVRFNEDIELESAENTANYNLSGFSVGFNVTSAKLTHYKNVTLVIDGTFSASESGTVTVYNVKDLDGNVTDTDFNTVSNVDWIPDSRKPHLVGSMNSWGASNHDYDLILNENAIWEFEGTLSSGFYEYKVIESDSWNDNDWPFENQSFTLTSSETIIFQANCGHYIGGKSGDEFVFHSKNPPVVVGDFLSEIGGTDWNQNTTLTQMTDVDDDEVYTFQTLISLGDYEFKIALNNNWDQNTSDDISFSSDSIQQTLFSYDMATNATSITEVTIFTAPQNLTTELSGDSIFLNWETPAQRTLSNYKIYRDGSFLDSTTETDFFDNTVSESVSYSYYITASYTSPAGESDPSNTVEITFYEQHQITDVQFLDSNYSTYTNFLDDQTLTFGTTPAIEVQVNGIDPNNVSNFEVTLHFKKDSEEWQEKSFNWFSNDEPNEDSYWRTELEHGSEILNGDSLEFYISATDYTETIYTDDNSGNYYHITLEGIAQAVNVAFSLNIGGYVADSVAVFGDGKPLNWEEATFLTDENNDKIFTGNTIFPQTSNDTVQYKYKRYFNEEWIWESLDDNRIFVIDDSSSEQELAVDNWSDETFNEITNVSFISAINSDFTNFSENDTLTTGSSIMIEAEIDGIDVDNNSDFQVLLNYTLDDTIWFSKEFYWNHNNTEADKSYWRVVLENGIEILDGELCEFYLSATDYNGPTSEENNNGMNYQVSIDNFGLSQDVTVCFSVNLGGFAADSISIQGNILPLDWEEQTILDSIGSGIYSADVLFTQGSASNICYKYKRYNDGEARWIWESIENRDLIIDDSSSLQILDTANWNNSDISEINSVTFFDSTLSAYTNFNNQDLLIEDSSLNFEVELEGIDTDKVSDFQVVLNYQITTRTWFQKDFSWFSNDTGNCKSYWRIELENGSEISNGDSIEFYISATDYTGNEYLDDNSGNNYNVAIDSNLTTQPVTVFFSLDLVGTQAYSVSLQGNISPLSWITGENLLSGPNVSDQYTIDLEFPTGTDKDVEYKYAIFTHTEDDWVWETTANRSFILNDDNSTQVLSIDVWNNGSLSNISSVNFLGDSSSDFTNFESGDTLITGSNLNFEVELDNTDENANSDFSATLNYSFDGTNWLTKSFDWNNNYSGKSYWHTNLENGIDVENGDNLEFYVIATDYTETIFTDNNGGANYFVSLSNDGLLQDVTVTFSLNIGSQTADNISLQGNSLPLDWTEGSNLMTDTDGNKIYSFDILFPTGSNRIIEYKYTSETLTSKSWTWESFAENRSFTIDDSDSTQTLDIDYWDNLMVNELTEVEFLPISNSQYTNFNHNEFISSQENVLIEILVNGVDENANSDFESILQYQVNSGSWNSKNFNWQSNNLAENYSIWQTSLENGTEVSAGDTINFYIVAEDYNGEEYSDNNNGQNYVVKIANTSTIQDITVNFQVNMSLYEADSVFVQGNTIPLSWDVGTTIMSDLNSDNIYIVDVVFPIGSNTFVEYKYVRALDNRLLWDWENMSENRSFILNDENSTQILEIDYWNDEIVEISSPQNPVLQQSGNDIVLSWEEVSGATGYNVYRSQNPVNGFAGPINSEIIIDTSYTDVGAGNSEKYFYYIKASN
ncbi:MAG: hypothetical protein K8S23_11840 [Candidatus Cloacimonetes bacterium]|nr:hypothetical protein [Candidatus Cloacimonadota bacterium]